MDPLKSYFLPTARLSIVTLLTIVFHPFSRMQEAKEPETCVDQEDASGFACRVLEDMDELTALDFAINFDDEPKEPRQILSGSVKRKHKMNVQVR